MRASARLLVALLLITTASLARAAGPETVTFETSDGFTLTADLWPAADPKAPVAILLHQFNKDRTSFGNLVPALQQQGFTVLSLDQRGQGGSTRQKTADGERTLRIRSLGQGGVGAVIEAGTADVTAALAFLKQRGMAVDRVVLVGASYGCTVSLLSAAKDASVRGVALLSPGASYFGVDALAAAKRFPGALFAIAAEDDSVTVSPGSAREMAGVHDGPEELLVYPKGGHGVALLDAHPELAAQMAAFLKKAVAS